MGMESGFKTKMILLVNTMKVSISMIGDVGKGNSLLKMEIYTRGIFKMINFMGLGCLSGSVKTYHMKVCGSMEGLKDGVK